MYVSHGVSHNSCNQLTHRLLHDETLRVDVKGIRCWEKSHRCVNVGGVTPYGVLLNHEAIDGACLDHVLCNLIDKSVLSCLDV